MIKTICIYILFFFVYSFLGWCLEVICKLITEKRFINRGILIGPICPIYGYGVLIMTLFFRKYLNDPITLFILIIVSCSILEYFTSYFLEKVYHTRWWDYSTKKFNINGRICLETMIPFGILGLLIMNYMNPIVFNLLNILPNYLIYILSTIFLITYIIDNIISCKIIYNIQKLSKEIQSKQIIKKDDTERITRLVRKQIEKSMKLLDRRLIHAFPHLEMLKFKKKKK
ncbi:MAG TPA: putative ABC transporter permease [Candidatus Faecimonas intestinavium]|jgi:uncharacterized membrane protein|nr:putative ABC transporter permease [Bacilli bacterium]HIT23245.1 putative ABC transporter permease [Candidatus Faecimonas intestinavium]